MDSNNIYAQCIASQNGPVAKENIVKKICVKLVCWTKTLKNIINTLKLMPTNF